MIKFCGKSGTTSRPLAGNPSFHAPFSSHSENCGVAVLVVLCKGGYDAKTILDLQGATRKDVLTECTA
jgi:hypothetical protein